MSTSDHWITTRTAEARASHSSVTQAASTRIAEMLKHEQQLSQGDLTKLSKALIEDMVCAQRKTEEEQ